MTAVSDNGTKPPNSQARLIALMSLADEAPMAAELAAFLGDADPTVRRTALDVLTESAPPDAAVPLAAGMIDDDAGVRAAAIDGLRELREVLHVDDEFAAALARAWAAGDAPVRVTVTRLWREQRIGSLAAFVQGTADIDASVRCEAVAGLVSLDAVDQLVALVGDPEAIVRLAVARAITTTAATLARSDARVARALVALADDADVRVRAAAVEGLGAVDLDERSGPVVRDAVADADWQVRRAAALALATAPPDVAVAALVLAAADPNIDVRKAAVQSLRRWVDADPTVRRALQVATGDPDADVRGYARLALG